MEEGAVWLVEVGEALWLEGGWELESWFWEGAVAEAVAEAVAVVKVGHPPGCSGREECHLLHW